MICWLTLALVFSRSSATNVQDDLQTILQSIADEKSKSYECSVGIGVKTDSIGMSVAAGNSDYTTGKEVKAIPSDRYVWGTSNPDPPIQHTQSTHAGAQTLTSRHSITTMSGGCSWSATPRRTHQKPKASDTFI